MIRQTARRVVALSAVILGASAAFVPSAFASENGGTQSGTLAAEEAVAYTPNAAGVTITPNTAQTDLNFGSVNVYSNAVGGWSLQVKTLNGAVLKTAANDPIAYTLKVDDTPVAIAAADTYVDTVRVNQSYSAVCATKGTGCNYTVKADIAAADSNSKPTGAYSDTITFKLTNN